MKAKYKITTTVRNKADKQYAPIQEVEIRLASDRRNKHFPRARIEINLITGSVTFYALSPDRLVIEPSIHGVVTLTQP